MTAGRSTVVEVSQKHVGMLRHRFIIFAIAMI